MRVCHIVGAGEIYALPERSPEDIVIAADGGYDALRRAGIKCDLLIGDMDSIGIKPSEVELICHPVEKDETDMYLAYIAGVERGYKDFVIYGGVGGREDHTFANYSLLIHAISQGNKVRLVGESFDIFAVNNEKISISGRVGATLSVFAFGADAEGVTLSGVKYAVSGITLTPTFPLGVSNCFAKPTAEIEVKNGTLLVMQQR